MKNFARLDRLPPYVFAKVNDLKMEYRTTVDMIYFQRYHVVIQE